MQSPVRLLVRRWDLVLHFAVWTMTSLLFVVTAVPDDMVERFGGPTYAAVLIRLFAALLAVLFANATRSAFACHLLADGGGLKYVKLKPDPVIQFQWAEVAEWKVTWGLWREVEPREGGPPSRVNDPTSGQIGDSARAYCSSSI